MKQRILLVSGPVIVRDGAVLLVKHGDTPFWKFCGGGVEPTDVNLQATAAREAHEELGIDLVFEAQPPFMLYVQKETPEGVLDVVLTHWLCTAMGEIKPRADIREWAWLPISSLPADVGPNVIPALRHFGFIS
jgi:8-oxo-dGTP pyrophosphatase MutT (NUDIX family)